MHDLLIWSLENARRQTLMLVEDLREELMSRRSAASENPPAWILGHLLLGDTYLLHLLEVQEFGAGFGELLGKYGPHSTGENYDSKRFLVERLTATGNLRSAAVREMDDFYRPMPDAMLAERQPTIGHHLQALVFHEGHHCGQLAAWRKRQGLSAVKGIFAS